MHPIATTTPSNSKPIPSTNPPGPGPRLSALARLSALGSRLLARLLPRLSSWLGSAQAPGSARPGSVPDSAQPRLLARLGSTRLPAPSYSELPPHDDIPRYLTAVAVALAIAFQALQALQASKLSKLPKLSKLSKLPKFLRLPPHDDVP